jgi:hypothetical protein
VVSVGGLNSFRDPYLNLQKIDMLDGATPLGEIPMHIDMYDTTYTRIG